MKCINKNCINDVPLGWEGGFCDQCCKDMQAMPDLNYSDDSEMTSEEIDKYTETFRQIEDYGFDRS